MSAGRSKYVVAGAMAGLCAVLVTAGHAAAAPTSDLRASRERLASSAVPLMPLGEAALPPQGFFDLCERSPDECLDGQAGRPDIAALRAAASRRFWADTFARQGRAPAALGPGAGDGGGFDASSTRVSETAYDWSKVFRPAGRSGWNLAAVSRGLANRVAPAETVGTVPLGVPAALEIISPTPAITVPALSTATVFADAEAFPAVVLPATVSRIEVEAPAAAEDFGQVALDLVADALVEGQTPAASDARPSVAVVAVTEGSVSPRVEPKAAFLLDAAGWQLVNQVNRQANRSIRQIADRRQYGVEDYWARPTGSRSRGDCEDYVLAKRRALISAGVPAEALSIAIVETRWGESHAVLLVASDQGEYVLDNLTPWISRWDRVNYVWHERQLPGRPFDWVQAAL